MLFTNVRLALPLRVTEPGAGAWLRVEDGQIAELGAGGGGPAAPRGRPGEPVIDGGGDSLLAPGFIDLHVHGALGRDAMEARPDAWATITGFHALAGGTTALALTTVAAPRGELRAVLGLARTWKAAAGARLLGVHLEGPCFSRAKRGAHRAECLRGFDPEEWREWLTSGVVTQATFAPELPGSLDLLDALLATGNVLPSAGHSDAWDEDVRAAFGRGLRHVTHLFNAMSGARRRGPHRVAGLLECALAEPGVVCEIIADGCHVSPTLLQLALRAKGPGGLVLVTDATAGAGLPENARYRLGGLLDCEVRDGVGVTRDPVTGETMLAGSTATMLRCVRNMVRLAGASLAEAVRMATFNPARAIGQEHVRGSLAIGLAADLVLLSPDLERVQAVFIAGERLAEAGGSARETHGKHGKRQGTEVG